MTGFENKVALVTGGASGIGKATVRALHAKGAKIVVGDINEANRESLKAEFGVSPGHTNTPLTAKAATNGMREVYFKQTPLHRIAEPEEIAASLLFLASDDAAFITGTDLLVDGGFLQSTHFDLRPFSEQETAGRGF